MKVRLHHQYLGAALMQVAEHPQFTAINSLKRRGDPVNNGFLINDDVALFLKYASEPNGTGEYVFTFNRDHIGHISHAGRQRNKVFLGLVCVQDEEICCLNGESFDALIGYRKDSAGEEEEQYQLLVKVEPRAQLRVYVNAAGVRRQYAGEQLVIPRTGFPNTLFG